MGNPAYRDGESELAPLLRLARDVLSDVVSAMDAAMDEDGDGSGCSPADDAIMAELRVRLRMAAKDLGVTSEPGYSPKTGRRLQMDPSRSLEYGQSMGFKSNDIVLLVAPDWYGDKYLKLSSASGPITLGNLVDFMLLRALARNAIENPGEFMRMPDLVDVLISDCDEMTTRLGEKLSDSISEMALWKALHRLRRKIGKAKGREEIIETSSTYNGGFRLSTPPWNIIIVDPTTGGEFGA